MKIISSNFQFLQKRVYYRENEMSREFFHSTKQDKIRHGGIRGDPPGAAFPAAKRGFAALFLFLRQEPPARLTRKEASGMIRKVMKR